MTGPVGQDGWPLAGVGQAEADVHYLTALGRDADAQPCRSQELIPPCAGRGHDRIGLDQLAVHHDAPDAAAGDVQPRLARDHGRAATSATPTGPGAGRRYAAGSR
jgi:hypothetical protein